MSASEHWSVDRKIPLAVIILFIAQFAGGVWFMANLSSRVEQLELRAIDESRLVRLEERMLNIKESLARIEGMVATLTANSIDPSAGSTEDGRL